MNTKLKESASALAKLAILMVTLLSIVNLFSEFLLLRKNSGNSIESAIKSIHFSEKMDMNFVRQHAIDQLSARDSIHFDYALGPVYDYSSAKSFKGDTLGRRVTPEKYLAEKRHQGLLLGASFTWGYFLEEKDILPNILSDMLTDVGIDNHSFKGKTLESLLVYLQSEKKTFENKDFIIVVGGTVDVAKSCYLDPESMVSTTEQKDESPLGIIRFINVVKNKFTKKETPHCKSQQELSRVFQRVFNYIELFKLEADKQHKRLLVVIPPTQYSADTSDSTSGGSKAFVLSEFDKAIDQQNYSFVLNLSHSFDDSNNYFIDQQSHSSSAGQRKIADDILRNVRPEFFDGRAIEPGSSYLIKH